LINFSEKRVILPKGSASKRGGRGRGLRRGVRIRKREHRGYNMYREGTCPLVFLVCYDAFNED
jgi:hypothetical protein